MSLYAAMIAIQKAYQLGRARRATLRFSPEYSRALTEGDFEAAGRLIDEHPRSHLAAAFRRVFSVALQDARAEVTPATVASVQRLIELNSLEQVSQYRRGLGVLATIGATAPFVGLLGTTMGVVNAFTGMAAAGSGGLSAISAGIAEALITTAFGLLVAIPAVWLYNYFINRIDFISVEITYATKEFMDFLLRHQTSLQREQGAVQRA